MTKPKMRIKPMNCDILHPTSRVASKFRSFRRSGRCFMEALTEVASSFTWKALTATDQRQPCLSPKGSGGEAYGLCHMTPTAGQPRTKAYSLSSSQRVEASKGVW